MGNYNTQYQSYYNNLTKKHRGSNKFSSEGNQKSSLTNFFIKRIIRELIGVLVLFVFVLTCKVVVTPKTQYAFNYSKQVINKQYNYSALIDKAKVIKFDNISSLTSNFIKKVKSSITNERVINSDF